MERGPRVPLDTMKAWAKDYDSGQSLRQVAENHGVSYGQVRRGLIWAGHPLRGVGQPGHVGYVPRTHCPTCRCGHQEEKTA